LRSGTTAIGAAALALAFTAGVQAAPVSYDEIIFEDSGQPGFDFSVLAGSVDMTFDSGSNTLTIVLTNTSSGVTNGDASTNLLTGIGFNLPTGVAIGSGSASVAAGSGVNWDTSVSGTDVSGEWGFDNDPLNSGPFQDPGITASSVNTATTAMEASTTDKFSDTPLFNPDTLDGPEFGLLSGSVDASTAGGLKAIQDTVTMSVSLSGTYSGDLLQFIDDNDVVLSFGSPNSSTVPEPATMAVIGAGLVGLGVMRRRRHV
jgi:hypothetical protein